MTEISLWWLLCYGGWGGSKRHHCDFFNHFQTYQPNRLCTSLWMPWMKNKFRLLSLKFEGFERSRFYYSYVKLSSFSCFNVSLRLFLLFFLTLPMQYVFLFKNRMLCLIAIHSCNFFFFCNYELKGFPTHYMCNDQKKKGQMFSIKCCWL